MKELIEAAEAYVEGCNWREFIYEDKSEMSPEDQKLRPSSIPANIALGFQAGALWAEKHSPRVLALVEALESLLNFTDALCEDVRVSKHYKSSDEARAILAAWREE